MTMARTCGLFIPNQARHQTLPYGASPCSMLGSLHGTIPGADVSAHADFGEMLGFTYTIFGQTPGR